MNLTTNLVLHYLERHWRSLNRISYPNLFREMNTVNIQNFSILLNERYIVLVSSSYLLGFIIPTYFQKSELSDQCRICRAFFLMIKTW